MPKWCKTIVAILLLPVCVGAAWALWLVLRATGDADTTWVPFLAGAASWGTIYVLLPKPMWVYILGHEFTHVLWTWLFGGRVKRFRASASGGHVVVTRSNFAIALAPYFFPVYAVLVMLVFLGGHWLWNWQHYLVWFHLLLGAAYAFHVTLTWHILKHSQSDISDQGYLFSAAVIFLGNVVVLLVGIPLLVPKLGVPTAFRWWWDCTAEVLHRLTGVI
ncbi:MAG TPA: hypothetical protein P5205_10205 [Candidatus Paceibacterota bacterium]|nr:hypothetical protein [Verrucomicrobiota bacterium]HSA10727.1 hypothetical protein [Candidatus Paceibacterota bacterium]